MIEDIDNCPNCNSFLRTVVIDKNYAHGMPHDGEKLLACNDCVYARRK